jgi:hypothetical protein
VIALYSPCGVLETGLLMCPSEKKAHNIASGVRRDTFSSPVLQQNVPNCGHLALFSEECRGFLCSSDCVAKGKEFELRVQVPGKPLRHPSVIDLRGTNPRNDRVGETEDVQRSNAAVRFLRVVEGRMPGDYRALTALRSRGLDAGDVNLIV